jgi:hypothetical protein
MKTGITIGLALFLAAVAIGVVQLWFSPWSPELFLKLELTAGAGLLVVVVFCFVTREYQEHKANRRGDRLD